MFDKPTSVVSNNDLLHHRLGPKFVLAPNRDELQHFGSLSRGTPQLANRQIRNFGPHGARSPVPPTLVYVVLDPPVTLVAIYECDRRKGFERGDESF